MLDTRRYPLDVRPPLLGEKYLSRPGQSAVADRGQLALVVWQNADACGAVQVHIVSKTPGQVDPLQPRQVNAVCPHQGLLIESRPRLGQPQLVDILLGDGELVALLGDDELIGLPVGLGQPAILAHDPLL